MSEKQLYISRRKFVTAAGLAGAGALAGGALAGCTSSSGSSSASASASSASTSASASASSASASASASGSAAAALDPKNWDAIVAAAKGQEVNLWMSAGTKEINDWVDGPATSYLADKFGIKLNRVPVNSSNEFVTQISSEMQAKKEDGTVDVVWANGSTFKSLKDNGYLYGPWTQDSPTGQLIDWNHQDNKYDAGVETEGLSMVWHRYTASFFADTDKVGTTFPTTPTEYLEWVKQFPGHFTYPAAGDSQGDRFMYTMFANIIGRDAWKEIATDLTLTKDQLRTKLADGLAFLRELNPYLWNKGETFPAKYSEAEKMYADGEIYSNFNVRFPQAKVDNGTYPAGTRCFVLKEASLCYNSYFEIAANASHKAAAMVAVNEICGPTLEASKFAATFIPSGLDYSKLSAEQKKGFDDVKLGPATLNPEDIEPIAIALASSTAIEIIHDLWNEEVVGKTNA